MVVLISERKLLGVTHFHLFSVPVYVLILAHLWVLARMPSWLHAAGVVLGVLSSGLHLAAPWIVRGSPSTAALVPVSGALMLIVLSIMAIVPTIDMWLPQVRRAKASDPPDAQITRFAPQKRPCLGGRRVRAPGTAPPRGAW